QVRKLAPRAGGAVGIARRRVDLANATVPKVQRGDARAQGGAGEDAQRVGHLKGGHGGDNHVQYAGGFAGGLRARRRVRVDAAQARGAAGDHRHGDAVAGHGRPVDPRDAAAHGKIVDQVARLEVVGAIQDDIGIAQQLRRVGAGEIGDDATRADGRVDARDAALGRGGLGQRLGGVGLFEKPLPMQVAGLHVIAIDQGESSRQSQGTPKVRSSSARSGSGRKGNYLSRDEAAQKIPAAFLKYYQENYPAIYAQ